MTTVKSLKDVPQEKIAVILRYLNILAFLEYKDLNKAKLGREYRTAALQRKLQFARTRDNVLLYQIHGSITIDDVICIEAALHSMEGSQKEIGFDVDTNYLKALQIFEESSFSDVNEWSNSKPGNDKKEKRHIQNCKFAKKATAIFLASLKSQHGVVLLSEEAYKALKDAIKNQKGKFSESFEMFEPKKEQEKATTEDIVEEINPKPTDVTLAQMAKRGSNLETALINAEQALGQLTIIFKGSVPEGMTFSKASSLALLANEARPNIEFLREYIMKMRQVLTSK